MITRDQEIDAAFALGALPAVVGVYVLNPILEDRVRAHSDALVLAVVLRPYSIKLLVEAHYKLLSNTSPEVTGRVLYMNAEGAEPPQLHRARPVVLSLKERMEAAVRAEANAADYARVMRMEEAAMEAEMFRQVGTNLDNPIAISLDSGIFEIVPDPFPSLTTNVRRPRVLVADADAIEADGLRASLLRSGTGVDIIHAPDGWSALEQLVHSDVDLALCALKLDDEFTGLRIYRMVAKQRPEMAARIVFMASADAVSQAPPSSALGRVLPRPITPSAVLQLLEQWKAPSSSSSRPSVT